MSFLRSRSSSERTAQPRYTSLVLEQSGEIVVSGPMAEIIAERLFFDFDRLPKERFGLDIIALAL